MASFNIKSFEKKLKALDGSQTGIQTLSLWIIHHRHHANLITATWVDYLEKVSRPERKLGLFYLANDVVQNGRRKAKELVHSFGRVFKAALPLLIDVSIQPKVQRVLDIWDERNIFDSNIIEEYKYLYGVGQRRKESRKVKKEEKKAPPPVRKTVPPEFKKGHGLRKSSHQIRDFYKVEKNHFMNKNVVALQRNHEKHMEISIKLNVGKLLVSIKKTSSLDNDLSRKSKTLDSLQIDASSFDSVKHVKDRSSVDRFFKKFEESKVILDDYCHNLKRSEKEKRSLLKLLEGAETFYDLAQEEAKVIVTAYDTFGNRLNAMKKKLDSKIRKLESMRNSPISPPAHSPISSADDSMLSDSNQESTSNFSKSKHEDHDDMDLGSDSGDDIPVTEIYNPSTAPMHDTTADLSQSPVDSEYQSQSSLQDSTNDATSTASFFDTQQVNGMTSFMTNNGTTLNTNDLKTVPLLQQQTSITESPSVVNVPQNNLLVVDSTVTPITTNQIPSMSNVLQNFGLLPAANSAVVTFTNVNTNTTVVGFNNVNSGSLQVDTSLPTPVTDEVMGVPPMNQMAPVNVNQVNPQTVTPQAVTQPDTPTPDGKESVQNLIDSLFPMLSKSLQTIKEKQQSVEETPQPSVSDAMAFALGKATENEESVHNIPKKKSRFSYTDPNKKPSPVSLTNPDGLSEHQEELISIAAGITKFDENFLPVSTSDSVISGLDNLPVPKIHEPTPVSEIPMNSVEQDDNKNKENSEERDKKRNERDRDDRKSRHSSGRHRSYRDDEKYRRSSSHSPNRRSSHRSSRDSRDDRHSSREHRDDKRRDDRDDRRRSKRSDSPKRRKSRSSHRSTSKEKEEPKRKRSPYYNDRKSPTPEMDSQTNPPHSFVPNLLPQQLINTMGPNPRLQIPPVNPNNTQLENHGSLQNQNPSIINSIINLTPQPMFSSSAEQPNSVGPTDTVSQTSADDSKQMQALQNAPDLQAANLHINAPPNRPPMVPFNPVQLTPRLEFDNTVRPVLAQNMHIPPPNHFSNPPRFITLRPLQTGLVPINSTLNQVPQVTPSFGPPIILQNSQQENPEQQVSQQEHDKDDKQTENLSDNVLEPGTETNENLNDGKVNHETQLKKSFDDPLQQLSQQAPTDESTATDFQLNPIPNFGNMEFSLPPPQFQPVPGEQIIIPPFQNSQPPLEEGFNPPLDINQVNMISPGFRNNEKFNRPIFRPRYRPNFYEGDPPLEHFERPNHMQPAFEPPQNFEPRNFEPRNFEPRNFEPRNFEQRPRFRPRFGPRRGRMRGFRPRFEPRPRFRGPRPR